MKNKNEMLSLELIHAAQQGDQGSRAELAELIRLKVYSYHYRMTLDIHTAEDLCQETMISFLENLGQLTIEEPLSLWAWVYKISLNKIRNYYNSQSVIKTGKTHMKEILSRSTRKNLKELTGPDYMIHQELLTAITRAIDKLKLQYRNILTLRCFQELSYAEIAQITGNSELGARLLFYRAKRSLTRQLARSGFSKSQLLSGLTLFASATLAPAEKAAAVTVSASVINTGLIIKTLAIPGTIKLWLSITAVCALTFITVGIYVKPDNDTSRGFHRVPDAKVNQINPAYPVAVRAAYDPDKNGWQGAFESEKHTERAHHPGTITLDQWLANTQGPDKAWLHLPIDHWIEVAFPAEIIDGEGDDIFITERCRHGESADVYLVDQNSNTCLLGTLHIPHTREHYVTTYGFDLVMLPESFSATAVRIKCTNNGFREYRTAVPGMELLHIRARTR